MWTSLLLPTYSYAKVLYKYPQGEFPYQRLIEENRRRGLNGPEYELEDTGIFSGNRYFDIFAEYAGPEDLLIRISVANRGPEATMIHVLPTLRISVWLSCCRAICEHQGSVLIHSPSWD